MGHKVEGNALPGLHRSRSKVDCRHPVIGDHQGRWDKSSDGIASRTGNGTATFNQFTDGLVAAQPCRAKCRMLAAVQEDFSAS